MSFRSSDPGAQQHADQGGEAWAAFCAVRHEHFQVQTQTAGGLYALVMPDVVSRLYYPVAHAPGRADVLRSLGIGER